MFEYVQLLTHDDSQNKNNVEHNDDNGKSWAFTCFCEGLYRPHPPMGGKFPGESTLDILPKPPNPPRGGRGGPLPEPDLEPLEL